MRKVCRVLIGWQVEPRILPVNHQCYINKGSSEIDSVILASLEIEVNRTFSREVAGERVKIPSISNSIYKCLPKNI